MNEPGTSRRAVDIEQITRDSLALRWALTGAARFGDAASAVYGTILAASLLIAVNGGAVTVIVTVVLTALVFWVAHVHVALLRNVVRKGEHVTWADARAVLVDEWPLAQASLTPLVPMLLAVFGALSVSSARTAGVVICLVELIAWGVVISRSAELGRRATALTIGINAAFGVVLIFLKFVVH